MEKKTSNAHVVTKIYDNLNLNFFIRKFSTVIKCLNFSFTFNFKLSKELSAFTYIVFIAIMLRISDTECTEIDFRVCVH